MKPVPVKCNPFEMLQKEEEFHSFGLDGIYFKKMWITLVDDGGLVPMKKLNDNGSRSVSK